MTLIALALFILCTAYSDKIVKYISNHFNNKESVCGWAYEIHKLKSTKITTPELKKIIIKPKEKTYFLKKHGKKA